MNTIEIYVVKEQKEEVLDKHPNLTSGVTIPVHKFETNRNFLAANDGQIAKFTEKALEKKSVINTDYDFSTTEKVKVVQNYDLTNPVFEGEIEIPKHLITVTQKYDGKGRIEVKGGGN